MSRPAIAVMAKAPRPGLAKTRLIPALGAEGAARLARAFLVDTAALVQAAARASGAAAYVLATPDSAAAELSALTGLASLPQGGGDLGARIVAAFAGMFARGHAPVLVVGADTPCLPQAHIGRALALAESEPNAAVFGPSGDGGYWCVALSAPTPVLFEGIAWGTAGVLPATRERAASAGITIRLAPAWDDVDDPADLAALADRLAADPEAAPATRAALAEIGFGR
jgi:rSAM/selenodomain-associated transferase 1